MSEPLTAAAPVYSRKERHHIASLDRRARFLEERSDGEGRTDESYDRAEAAAIRWVLATLDALRAADDLDAAWSEAEAALRALSGGSPYLDVTCDLMAWCVATARNSDGYWEHDGDDAAAALRSLAVRLREVEG